MSGHHCCEVEGKAKALERTLIERRASSNLPTCAHIRRGGEVIIKYCALHVEPPPPLNFWGGGSIHDTSVCACGSHTLGKRSSFAIVFFFSLCGIYSNKVLPPSYWLHLAMICGPTNPSCTDPVGRSGREVQRLQTVVTPKRSGKLNLDFPMIG